MIQLQAQLAGFHNVLVAFYLVKNKTKSDLSGQLIITRIYTISLHFLYMQIDANKILQQLKCLKFDLQGDLRIAPPSVSCVKSG